MSIKQETRQESYLDGWIKDITKNTGQGQKEIGDDRKKKGQKGKEPWRQNDQEEMHGSL